MSLEVYLHREEEMRRRRTAKEEKICDREEEREAMRVEFLRVHARGIVKSFFLLKTMIKVKNI